MSFIVQKDIEFELFTPKSKFTDDTVMTCAVAEWLMEDPNHTHEELVKIMHRYGDEYVNDNAKVYHIFLKVYHK